MKYGVCNWIFGDEPLAETAARLAGFGYDGLELRVGILCGRYPQGVDKGAGVRWLSQEMGIPLDQIGGIGDSASDLKFLSILARSAALANAADEVKAAVGYVSPYEDGDGVVDILRRWVEQSASLAREDSNSKILS